MSGVGDEAGGEPGEWPVFAPMFYDRDARPISMPEYLELEQAARDRGEDYKRVAEDRVGPYWVSTVWLGIDHTSGFGAPDRYRESGGPLPPLIFETMVFAAGSGEAVDPDVFAHPAGMWRYPTEDEARRGHDEVVTLMRSTIEFDPDLNTEPLGTDLDTPAT